MWMNQYLNQGNTCCIVDMMMIAYIYIYIYIFQLKLTFGMLTVRRQQHSFSTHEWMFLWKCLVKVFETENVCVYKCMQKATNQQIETKGVIKKKFITVMSLKHHCISNCWQLDWLFNSLLRLTTKETSKFLITVFCEEKARTVGWVLCN